MLFGNILGITMAIWHAFVGGRMYDIGPIIFFKELNLLFCCRINYAKAIELPSVDPAMASCFS